jgi:hypothetical protein
MKFYRTVAVPVFRNGFEIWTIRKQKKKKSSKISNRRDEIFEECTTQGRLK